MKVKDAVELISLYDTIMIRPMNMYRDEDAYDYIGLVKDFRKSPEYEKLKDQEVFSIHSPKAFTIVLGIEAR